MRVRVPGIEKGSKLSFLPMAGLLHRSQLDLEIDGGSEKLSFLPMAGSVSRRSTRRGTCSTYDDNDNDDDYGT